MRIGVDLTPLNSPLTGVGNYTAFLLEALLKNPEAPAIYGFEGLRWRPMHHDYFLKNGSKANELSNRAGGFRSLGKNYVIRRFYSVLRRKAFETSTAGKAVSLFHAFAYIPPGHLQIPTIPVVYDLSFVRFPDMHPEARVRALDTLGKHIQSAPAVHTISCFSAREIADVYGIETSRITVIYPGVRPVFLNPSIESQDVLAFYKLTTEGYFLVVSTLEPRKNLRTLISAFLRLPQSLRARIPLCIVGGKGWHQLDLPKGFESLQNEGSLRFLGFVPDRHLKTLYEHARTMLYPSTYEGFGMPIIEALACGTAIVCSNTTSMPEAGGTAARTVAPLDVEAWTEEFRRAADDPSYGQKALRKAHASQFTWERSAQQTIALYSKIQDRHSAA